MADSNYKVAKKDNKPVERTPAAPITTAKVRKKSLGKKFKETFICQDAKEVKDDVVDRVVIPTIKDLVYDIFTGVIEGLLFGGEGGRRKRRRGSNGEKSNISYTNYYKTSSSRSRDRDDRPSRRQIDLDEIIFDAHGGTLDDRDDAQDVVDGLKQRIHQFGSALVQDVYDFIQITPPDYMVVEYGWDSVDELNDYSISKDRGCYILSLPAPHRLDK